MATTNLCSSDRDIEDMYNRDLKNNHYYVHYDGSIRLEQLEVIATRPSSSSSTVNLQINTQIYKYGSFGTGLWLILEVLDTDGNHITVYDDASHQSQTNIGNWYSYEPGNRNALILSNAAVGNSTETDTVYCSISTTSSTYGIRFRIWCNGYQYSSCTDAVDHGWSRSGVQSYYTFASNNIDLPSYVDPYSYPTTKEIQNITYTGNNRTDLIKKIEDDRYARYNIVCGNGGAIDWIDIGLFPTNVSWNADNTWDYGSSVGKTDISNTVKNSIKYRKRVARYYGTDGGSKNETKQINLSNQVSDPQTPDVGNVEVSNIASGTAYKIAVIFSDNHAEWISSSDKTVYVYQKPTLTGVTAVRDGTTTSVTQINANQGVKFTLNGTNNRAFTGSVTINDQPYQLEQEFKTYYRFNVGSTPTGNWTDLGNVITKTWSSSDIRSTVIPYNSSTDGSTVYVQFRRTSPSSGENTNPQNKTIKVYYKPRNSITSWNYKQNNSSGANVNGGDTILDTNSFSGIYTSWNYDTDLATAGYTQGYRIRLYVKNSDNTYTLQHTFYTKNKNYTISKQYIPRSKDTYIDITPYFANGLTNPGAIDSSMNYVYYDTADPQKNQFIKLISVLPAPVIDFPIANSKWINKDLRIGFILPEDSDYSAIGSSYRYENIEVQLDNSYTVRFANSVGTTTTGTTVQSTACFSTIDLTHKKSIVVYPDLVFANRLTAGNHTIRARVKKQYNTTQTVTGWSDWSTLISFTVYTPTYSVMQDNTDSNYKYIRASHFNGILDYVTNICNTYNVSWSNPGVATQNVTTITQNQYKYNKMLKGIQDVCTKVNTYATYDNDKNNIKINQGSNIIISFTTYQELVTEASNESSPGTGRNYMQIIFDKGQLLK